MGLLSANTLFHFTPSLQTLISILHNGFEPRYSEEFQQENSYIRGPLNVHRTWTMSFPMVCFCDIPLSSIKNHIQLYGGFGIGLSKGWGISSGLNPVHYVNLNSQALKLREQNLTYLLKRIDKAIGMLAEATVNIPDSKTDGSPIANLKMHLNSMKSIRHLDWDSMYLKPYSAKTYKNKPDYIFYDEKEWRYVPLLTGDEEYDGLLQFSSPVREEKRSPEDEALHLNFLRERQLQLKLAGLKNLDFTPTDIKYLFVENDESISHLMSYLKFSGNYNEEEIGHLEKTILTPNRLAMQALTPKQMEEDF